jgi:hypothetical protein
MPAHLYMFIVVDTLAWRIHDRWVTVAGAGVV